MSKDENEKESTSFNRLGFELRCDDHWTWDKNQRSHEVIFNAKNARVAHFHPNWSSGTAAVQGTRILNNGRYYWELVLSRRIFGTSMMFGVGTKRAKLHEDSFINLIGIDEHSWGLSHKGLIWHNGCWTYYTKPFRENVSTRIGIFFDGIAGTLTFYKDAKCLGTAFKGLNQIKEPLFPMVCSTAAKTEMTLENMKREFNNLQDRCRTIIVQRIRCKQDVKKLHLPPRIQAYLSEVIDDNVEPMKFVNQNLNYLETNFLTTMPSKN